jgi:putative lipoprotein
MLLWMTRPSVVNEIGKPVIALLLLILTASVNPAAAQTQGENPVGFSAQLRFGVAVSVETPALADTLDRPAPPTGVRPQLRDPWFSFDKVQHFTFSALFTVGGQYALESKADWNTRNALPVAILTSFTIGLTKELYDWQAGPRRYFSWRDMAANGAGIAVATGFILL